MRCSECSLPVKPIIAVDIDGTLADYHGWFLQFARTYDDRPDDWAVEEYDGKEEMHEWMGVTLDHYRDIKLAYRQGGMKRSMPKFPGANRLVDRIRAAGAEVWVTTTRPHLRLDNIDPDTREWLRRNGIEYDGLLYGDDKYGQLIGCVDRERIVGVIDDLPEMYDRADELGLYPYLIGRLHNRWGRQGRRFSLSLREVGAVMEERINLWNERNG